VRRGLHRYVLVNGQKIDIITTFRPNNLFRNNFVWLYLKSRTLLDKFQACTESRSLYSIGQIQLVWLATCLGPDYISGSYGGSHAYAFRDFILSVLIRRLQLILGLQQYPN